MPTMCGCRLRLAASADLRPPDPGCPFCDGTGVLRRTRPLTPADLKTEPMPVACFAPPLTDELLAQYQALADGLPDSRGDVRDAMRECLAAVRLWWELPDSPGHHKDRSLEIRHRGRDVSVRLTSLTPDLREKLFDAVPWPYELDAMQALFDAIDPAAEKALRDAAFHLLWFARELCLDREPLTLEKLPT